MLPGGVHSYVDLPRVLTNLDQILNFILQFLHIHQVCYRCHTESMINVQSKIRVILRMASIEIENMQRRTLFMIGGTSALLLLGILLGAFFAGPLLASANGGSTASATATTNPYCQQYLQDLANRLNVPVSTLQQDKLAAREDVINQMVKDGKLTQSQANTIKQRLTSHQACSGKGSWGQHFVTGQFLQKYRSDIATEVAQGLHLNLAQFNADLKSGKSISDIATAQNVTTAQLHTLFTNAIQNALHKAVSAGDLTQAQADAFTQSLQKHPALLDRFLGRHFGK